MLWGGGPGVVGEPAPGAVAARAGADPLSRSGFRRGQLAADAAAAAAAAAAAGPRALLARLGLPGLGGGAGADPAPCLGVSYHAAVLVFWRFPSTPPPFER